MSCLFGCLGFFVPRIALVVLWLSGYLGRAYDTLIWPLLGFVFLPLTTLMYAWVINSHGQVDGLYTVGVTLAVLADLGVLSGARGREDD